MIKYSLQLLLLIFISCGGAESEEETISTGEQNNSLESDYIPTDYELSNKKGIYDVFKKDEENY